MMGGSGFLKEFDAFAKPLKDFRIKTLSGALVSILSSIVIFFLFVSELIAYLKLETRQEIIVDVNRGEKMLINLDISLPYIPCAILKLDTMDTTGEHQLNVEHEIYKTSIATDGTPISSTTRDHLNSSAVSVRGPDYCGSCYGAETPEKKCCNTCDEVQQAYQDKRWSFKDVNAFEQCRKEDWSTLKERLGHEGCRIHGKLHVNKVAGSFHIAPGHSYTESHVHVHNIQNLGLVQFNMTHTISALSFGYTYPGQINPLDKNTMPIKEESQMVSYYLKLVPTIFNRYGNKELNFLPQTDDQNVAIETNQYSVTWHVRSTPLSGGSGGLPGLFFNYEIAPLLVKISEEKRSLIHFLTNTCAIIGGVFTVASLFDAFIYQSSCVIARHRK